MQTPAGKRPISRCFDLGVDGIGVAVICWALASFLLSGSLDRTWVLAAAGGVPLIALMSRFPLVLTRGTGGIEVGFESAVLVFLACLDGGSGALAVWSAGQAVSQLTTPKRPDVRVFNVALSTISGGLALTTMRGIGGLGTSSPRELLAAGVVGPPARGADHHHPRRDARDVAGSRAPAAAVRAVRRRRGPAGCGEPGP